MLEPQFAYISPLIDEARSKAFAAINQQLVQLYWQIGEYVSKRVEAEEWGKQTVEALAAYLQNQHPGLKGFGRRSLFRMKQFYETYRGEEKVSALLTQISWSSHLDIMSKTKSQEEREFYLKLAINERLSVRELRRHLNTAYFERVMLADQKLPPSMNRNISPAVIADCATKLIDKEVLRQKLHELFEWQENTRESSDH